MNPFLITCMAGFSTLVGTFLIFKRQYSKQVLISSLGFASGVMMMISIVDLLPTSFSFLTTSYYVLPALLILLLFFGLGALFSLGLNHYLPTLDMSNSNQGNYHLYRVGLFLCLAIVLHNIPEGMITYITSNQDIKLGIHLAIAIALHNIPEGISISIPIYYSTGSRKRALKYTFISAISEPIGAILAFLLFSYLVSDVMMGVLYAFIGGLMMYIAGCELLPESLSYRKRKLTYFSFFAGCLFMLISHFFFF